LDQHIKIKLERLLGDANEAANHLEFKNILLGRLENIKQQAEALIDQIKQSEAEKELLNLFDEKKSDQ